MSKQDIIEELEEKAVPCAKCNQSILLKSYVIREAKPYKYICSTDCTYCGHKDTYEDDYQILDHGVKITCDFTNKDKLADNLRRMVYIHKQANITFLDSDNKELFTFNDHRSHVDCIQGVWIRSKEIFLAQIQPGDNTYDKLFARIDTLMNSSGFKMIVKDNSGYSKIAPFGVECIEIEDLSFDEMNKNDSEVFYERIEHEAKK